MLLGFLSTRLVIKITKATAYGGFNVYMMGLMCIEFAI